MNTQKEILDFLRQNRKFLLENYHITKIGLFGSFAKNEQKEHSDIDLLIDLEDGVENIHDLKLSLKNYLKNSLGRNVDLAREKYLKPYAKKYILRDVVYV